MARAGVNGGGARVGRVRPVPPFINVVPQTVVPALKAMTTNEMSAGEKPREPAHAADGLLASSAPAPTAIGVMRGRQAGALRPVLQNAARRPVVRMRPLRDVPVHTVAQVVARAVRHLRRLGAPVRMTTPP